MIDITHLSKFIDKMQEVVSKSFDNRQSYRTKTIFDDDECQWLDNAQAMFFCSKKNKNIIDGSETKWSYSPLDITYEEYWYYQIEIHFPNTDDELYYKLKWL